MTNILQTPDILLQIVEHTDISALLTLRAVCKTIHSLVTAYESSIATALARRSYPNLSLDLSSHQCVASLRQLRYWSRRSTARTLTLLSLAEKRMDLDIACAFGPLEIRPSVENGWMIAHRFHDVSRRIENRVTAPTPRLKRMLSLGSAGGETSLLQKAEHDVSEEWLQLASRLSVEEAVDFELMLLVRDGKFLERGSWSLWSSAPVKYPRRGLGWFKGCLLRTQPSFVADLWSSDLTVREGALRHFDEKMNGRSEKRILMEESTWRQLQDDLHALHPSIRQHCSDIYSNTFV